MPAVVRVVRSGLFFFFYCLLTLDETSFGAAGVGQTKADHHDSPSSLWDGTYSPSRLLLTPSAFTRTRRILLTTQTLARTHRLHI
jgi:hypothetical protein